MAKQPKILQLIAAPLDLSMVRTETRNKIRIADPVIALALVADGTIRPVFVARLQDDNVGRLQLGAADALFYPPAPD